MDDHQYSPNKEDTEDNYEFAQSFATMSYVTNSNPKFIARNSYTRDTGCDFSDVFGGPPKYITGLHSSTDIGKTSLPKEPYTVFPRPCLLEENPLFGEAKKTEFSDDFFCDIFSADTLSVASEISAPSRPVSRTISPAQSPLQKMPEQYPFRMASPLSKTRESTICHTQKENSMPGMSLQTCDYANDLDEPISSSIPSVEVPSSGILEIPFGCPIKTSKNSHGPKYYRAHGKTRMLSPDSEIQSLFEEGEKVVEFPPRMSNEKLCSTPKSASCGNASDDDWERSMRRFNTATMQCLTKGRHSSGKIKACEALDNGFEKARLSASDIPFAEHQPLHMFSSPQGSHSQTKLKSWRDWMADTRGSQLRQESGSVSMNSSGISSAKEIHTSNEILFATEANIGIEKPRDSGEESDDLGSYFIEIDAEKGEMFGFIQEKEIQIDTTDTLSVPNLSGKELSTVLNDKTLHRELEDDSDVDDKFKMHRENQSVLALGMGETSRQIREGNFKHLFSKSGQYRYLSYERSPFSNSSTDIVCNKIAVEQKSFSATSPITAKEIPINESHRTSVGDPYSVDVPSMVKEVAERIEKWQYEKPAVFHEIPVLSRGKEKASPKAKAMKEYPESRRKFGLGKKKGNECSSNTVTRRKQKELQESVLELNDKIKMIDAVDEEIKQWAAGKEGNIRALLSTLQYVLWPNSGWKPIPLIEIIEGSAVKKAYQKARIYIHPDKLQQKEVTFQQKYTADKILHKLQEAWTIFESLDPF